MSGQRARATVEQRLACVEKSLAHVIRAMNETAQKMAALSHQLELVKNEVMKLVGDGK